MAFWGKVLRAWAMAGLAWSAAGAALAKTHPMALGEAVAPPAGYVDFCRRQPQDCGTDQVPAPAAPPHLGPGLWSKLNDVNVRVNRAIAPRTDAAAFGLGDYWQTPLESGRGYGDCEDYVLEKVRALVAAGLPRSTLDIALVVTRAGETHAVLLVDTSAGEMVLDNLRATVQPWDVAPYRWLSRQTGGRPGTWARIAG